METFSVLLALCAGNSPVPVNSLHKGQWCGALMFSLICAWINDWVNNHEAGDLRRHLGQYDVNVTCDPHWWCVFSGILACLWYIMGFLCMFLSYVVPPNCSTADTHDITGYGVKSPQSCTFLSLEPWSWGQAWSRCDDVIKWRHFPRYWPFVRGIHLSPVNSTHKGQWRGALMFSLISARINGWVNKLVIWDAIVLIMSSL